MERYDVRLSDDLVAAMDAWAERLGVDRSRVARAWWQACRGRDAPSVGDGGRRMVSLAMDDGWSDGLDGDRSSALRGALLSARQRAERAGMLHPDSGEVVGGAPGQELALEPVAVNGIGRLLRCKACGRAGVLRWLSAHRCGDADSRWVDGRRAAR